MKTACVVALVLAATLAVQASPIPSGDDSYLFQDPSTLQYVANAVMILPYSGTSEPIRVYYDGPKGRSRTEYWDGMDVYIYRADLLDYGTYYQTSPVSFDNTKPATLGCFQVNGTSDGPVAIQNIIPDISNFTAAGATTVLGVNVLAYTFNFTFGEKFNQYTFYIDAVTKAPVQYHMQGYDTLLGSHYDEYVLNFQSFSKGAPEDSVFNPPTGMSCGDFPGPGAKTVSRGALGLIEEPMEEAVAASASHFECFKNKYNKTYASAAHHSRRHMLFTHNKRFVETHNRKRLSYTVAINHLADLEEAELKTMRGSRSSRTMSATVEQSAPVAGRPSAVDWREKGAVAPVKDQGICGSCWTFGTAGSIESAYFIKYGSMIQLSEQSLVDCAWAYGNNGCDGGEAERAYDWILKNGFIPTEESYGNYLMADGYCHIGQSQRGASLKSYINVTSGDIEATLNYVANNGPLAIAIDASIKAFSFYSSGVFYDADCGNTPDDLDHEVLLVGYGTDPTGGDYWVVKNSWSTHYGNNGYVLMSRKDNNCGVATDANLPIVA